MKCVLKHQDLQIFGLNMHTYISNWQQFEVVGRGGETILYVGENFKKFRPESVGICT